MFWAAAKFEGWNISLRIYNINDNLLQKSVNRIIILYDIRHSHRGFDLLKKRYIYFF